MDYVNNRIQIFTPDGKLKESMSVNRPTYVSVHQKSGEIFVATWSMSHNGNLNMERIMPQLLRFEGKEGHKKLGEYALPFVNNDGNPGPWGGWMGVQYRVELDAYTPEPTIWLVPGQAGGNDWAAWGIKILAIENEKLVVKKDFGAEAHKTITCDAASGGRQRIVADPKSGDVFMLSGIGTATGDRIVEIDPVSGKDNFVELPFGSEDLCFDINGLAYLRTGDTVVRYDPSNKWREVTWDYGEDRESLSHCGGRAAKVVGGLAIPGMRPGPWYHGGGFGVSPKGHLVVQCFTGGNKKLERPEERTVASKMGKPYEPQIFPGRQRWGEIHIFDKKGKLLYEDVAPGVSVTDGVCIDRDDRIYVMTNPGRTPGGKNIFNPLTETLIKFVPGKGKVITSGGDVPVPLSGEQKPDRPTDMYGTFQSPAWVEGAEWLYGGVGYAGTWRCTCWNARFTLDYYARSFAPEPDRFCVAVLDTNGNLIVRIGQCGNIDDGVPLVPDPAVKDPHPIGGDETAIMHACYVAVDTDRRLFIEDTGNRRIASVKMGYATEENISLKTVPDMNQK